MGKRTVVIGVGNPYRRDDGVGPAVVTRLAHAGAGRARLALSQGEASELIELWDAARLAIVVDAVRADPPHPGRIHRLVVPRTGGELLRAASAHGMDLGHAVELARVVHRLPERLVLFAVEAADTGYGMQLTPEVAEAADRLAAEIAADLAALADRAKAPTQPRGGSARGRVVRGPGRPLREARIPPPAPSRESQHTTGELR